MYNVLFYLVLQRINQFENGQKYIKNEIENIKTIQAKMLATLNILTENISKKGYSSMEEEAESEPNVELMFPIKSYQEVDKIETQLRTDYNFKKNVVCFKYIMLTTY